MLEGSRQLLSSLQHQYDRLERVSDNFAHADTPGYRASRSGQRGGEFSSWMEKLNVSIKPGQDTDVALAPDAYLEVQTPTGTAFTRRGDLRLDDSMTLVTGAGDQLLDEKHEVIRLPGGNLTVTAAGEVRSGERLVAKLGRYKLDTPTPAPGERQFGGTLYAPAEGTVVAADRRELRVGELEASNVDVHREQTEQLDLLNRAQMLAAAMQVSDKTTELSIRDLGRSR